MDILCSKKVGTCVFRKLKLPALRKKGPCPGVPSLILRSISSQSDTNEEHVARTAGEVCIRLHLAEESVCRSITELFRDDIIRALQRSLFLPREACALLVGPSCGKYDIYAPWNVTLPGIPKPPAPPPSPPKPGSPQSRVLFLTDVHWDQVARLFTTK